MRFPPKARAKHDLLAAFITVWGFKPKNVIKACCSLKLHNSNHMLSKKHTEKQCTLFSFHWPMVLTAKRFHVRGRKCGCAGGRGRQSLGTSGFQVSRHPSYSLPPSPPPAFCTPGRGKLGGGFIVTITMGCISCRLRYIAQVIHSPDPFFCDGKRRSEGCRHRLERT